MLGRLRRLRLGKLGGSEQARDTNQERRIDIWEDAMGQEEEIGACADDTDPCGRTDQSARGGLEINPLRGNDHWKHQGDEERNEAGNSKINLQNVCISGETIEVGGQGVSP